MRSSGVSFSPGALEWLVAGQLIERHGRRAHYLGVVGHVFEPALFAATWTRLPILRWPENPLWPATEESPSSVEPAIPTCEKAGNVCRFSRCADLDGLSILVPRLYRLTRGRAINRRPARFNIVLDQDDSDLQNLVMPAIVLAKPYPSEPMMTPAWMMHRRPMRVPS